MAVRKEFQSLAQQGISPLSCHCVLIEFEADVSTSFRHLSHLDFLALGDTDLIVPIGAASQITLPAVNGCTWACSEPAFSRSSSAADRSRNPATHLGRLPLVSAALGLYVSICTKHTAPPKNP